MVLEITFNATGGTSTPTHQVESIISSGERPSGKRSLSSSGISSVPLIEYGNLDVFKVVSCAGGGTSSTASKKQRLASMGLPVDPLSTREKGLMDELRRKEKQLERKCEELRKLPML